MGCGTLKKNPQLLSSDGEIATDAAQEAAREDVFQGQRGK